MSKDIRSFFAAKTKKSELQIHDTAHNKKKKRVILIESDSDETQEISPVKKGTPEGDKNKVKKEVEKLKPVNVVDVFGNTKIKRSTPNSALPKKNVKTNVIFSKSELEEIHSDDDFEATLCQIDEIEKRAIHSKTKKESLTTVPKSEEIYKQIAHKSRENFTPNAAEAESSTSMKEKHNLETKDDDKSSEVFTPKSEKRKSHGYKNSDDKVTSPTDPSEKKRLQAVNYMKYLNRGGPKHLGSKELPKGKAGCLSGLAFVISGVLDSLEREQAAQLIEQYGGRVTTSVSRNTSYLLRGEEAGQSKLNKAESLRTPIIDEDGLFDLIKNRSAKMAPEEHVSLEDSRVSHKRKKSQDSNNQENKEQTKKIKVDSTSKKTEEKVKCTPLEKTEEKSIKKEHSSLPYSKIENIAVQKEKNFNITYDYATLKSSLWVDKYKPTKTKQIIGQQGDRSCLKKLMNWLYNWHKNHSGNKKLIKPSPWARNDDGAFFKAALLSGPPGIGKTTMAHLVSKELGFDVVEFNASDTRSKKLLHTEISELLSSKSLFGYFSSEAEDSKPSAKHVLLMDEVDGMAGNEDRGGVQELIQLIKKSHIPIICMCNDRNHPKIRSLANYCFDLRVMKPRLEQIRSAMMSICYKEGVQISSDNLNEVICGSNFDIRQILHHISLWSAREKQSVSNKQDIGYTKIRKDMKMGPWDVVKKVFSAEDHKNMSIHEKSDLFFHDYSINPLFVQENYLSVSPIAAKGSNVKTLQCIAAAAESISMGDVIDKCIRSRGSWSLLPMQAMFSSVIPGDVMEGFMRGQINFPAWFGKNSRTGKLDRLLQELHVHTRLSTSGSKAALNLDYLLHIRDAIIFPLIQGGVAGVPDSLNVMQSYNLLREDLDSILELTLWPNQKDPMCSVESKVKAALTRAYNKEGILTPYSVVNVVKKRSAGISDGFEDAGGEEEEEEYEGNDDVNEDAMIKTKKQKSVCDSVTKASRGRGKVTGETSNRGNQKRGRGRGKL